MEIEKIMKKLSDRTPNLLGSDSYSRYAVLIPLIMEDDQVKILFEVRSMDLRRQPGEICFPGGRIDPTDKNERETAIRETIEELGSEDLNVTNVVPLDFMVNGFRSIIYPFVGTITNPEKINPNPMEVGEIFTVPLALLKEMEPSVHHVNLKVVPGEGFPFDKIPGGVNYNWQDRSMDEYFYFYKDKTIWGLTARILTHFLQLIE
ncbi:NUDIX hydrolase [Cytobacillus sp. Hz8]|uniref:NUDIX hydrolase n=1 Tax=Cytobacillus sp. Hz8 TaxID=3347168 RepID=UPI0035E348F1